MAGLNLSISFDDVTLTVGSFKTVLCVKAPTNQMVRVKSIWQAFSGVAGDAAPLDVRLMRTTAASGTGITVVAQKLCTSLSATAQTTARKNFTVEPTADGTDPYLYWHKVHPQGASAKESTFDECFIKEGTELALQIKVPSGGTAVTTSGHMIVEE